MTDAPAQAIVDLTNGCRPISTAPKDGTRIIVYRPSFDAPYIPIVGEDYWNAMLGCWGRSRSDTPPVGWWPMPEAAALLEKYPDPVSAYTEAEHGKAYEEKAKTLVLRAAVPDAAPAVPSDGVATFISDVRHLPRNF